MKYGFCTGFATEPLWLIKKDMLECILLSGYDYAELPVMSFSEMDEETFSSTLSSFSFPVACNLFPGTIPLVDKTKDIGAIRDYLDIAFTRCNILGIKETVFGSGKARSYNSSAMTKEEAMDSLKETIEKAVIPKAEEYGITVLIEPLKRDECNLINTVEEGYSLSLEFNNPSLRLMADIYHMESNGEDISSLEEAYERIDHIHIAGRERNLSTTLSNPYILSAIALLKGKGYDKSISFETTFGDISPALVKLKTLI